MSLIDGHVCNGGGKIKGLIRRYPSFVCSSCRGDGKESSVPSIKESIDIHMSEKNIDIYNQKILDKIGEQDAIKPNSGTSTNN